MAAMAEARRVGGKESADRRMDEFWEESRRYDDMLKAASAAVLEAAPPDMPPIRDRDLGVGIGLVTSGVCYVFETDAGLTEARTRKLTDWLERATREQFLARGYPSNAIEAFSVRFTTHEVIVREAGGDYHVYFQ